MNLLNDIQANYGFVINDMEQLTGGWINQKYLIKTSSNNLYVLKEISLKKFPSSYLKYLIKNVELQQYLYNQNILVPKVILNKNENCVTKFSNDTYFFVQEYVDGYSKEFDQLNETEIYSIGQNLAKLHNKLKNVNSQPFKSSFLKLKNLNILKQDLKTKQSQINPSSSFKFIQELEKCKKILIDIENNNILDNNNQLQLIHGDFTPDNIIFEDNNVKAILDFELVRINSKLQDIGRIVLSTAFINFKFDSKKIQSFINGYSSISKIDYSDIINSLKFVWINEFDIWIQDRYFKNYNPPKVEKFMNEIIWIGDNWFNLKEKIGGDKKYEKK